MKLSKLAAVVAVLIASSSANAATIQWTIDTPILLPDNNGMITGSFVYDRSTNTYSDILLTASGTGADGLYSFKNTSGTANNLRAFQSSDIGYGSPLIGLGFSAFLPDNAGTVDIRSAFVGHCSSTWMPENCQIATSLPGHYLDTPSGFTVSSVVPVPASVWLFGSGLIGLVGFAKRKKA